MLIHLINNKDVNRGGAQKMLALIHGITGGQVLCLTDSQFTRKPFALLDIYLKTINQARHATKVVAHSRMYLPLLFMLRLMGVKTCFYLHASYRAKPWLFKLLRANEYIAVSQSAKSYLMAQGISETKISVVYNPLTDAQLLTQPIDILDSVQKTWLEQLQSKTIKVFSVGSLHPWKGFKEAIQMLDHVAQNLDIKIVYSVVGQGPELENLQKQVIKLKSEHLSVKLLGFSKCPYQLVTDAYIQLIPSLEEGFGLTLIEGMANNKLILYRQIPSLHELAEKDPFCFGFDHKIDVIDHLNERILIENVFQDKNLLKNRQRAIELKFSYDNFVTCINDTLMSSY